MPLTSHDGVDGVRENDDEVVGVSVEENCSSRVLFMDTLTIVSRELQLCMLQ